MKIKKLELVFENCEVIDFNDNDIEFLSISVNEKIFHKYRRNDNLNINYAVSELHLILNKSSNKEYLSFDIEDKEYNTMKFDRIKQFMDITQIYIQYENEKEDIFYVYFADDNDDINNNQIVKEDINGNLKIMIKSC